MVSLAFFSVFWFWDSELHFWAFNVDLNPFIESKISEITDLNSVEVTYFWGSEWFTFFWVSDWESFWVRISFLKFSKSVYVGQSW